MPNARNIHNHGILRRLSSPSADGERAPLGLGDEGDWSHAPAVREKAWRKSEIARSACATMRVSRTISIYRAQRSQQGCSLSLGMLRLAEPPTGRARLRSSLKSPRNPITPIETTRVATLHPELYKNLREGARRVIGATAKSLYAIDGKAEGLDRRSPKTSLLEGGEPPRGRWKELRKTFSKLHMLHMHHVPDTYQAYDVFFSFFELLRSFFANTAL